MRQGLPSVGWLVEPETAPREAASRVVSCTDLQVAEVFVLLLALRYGPAEGATDAAVRVVVVAEQVAVRGPVTVGQEPVVVVRLR